MQAAGPPSSALDREGHVGVTPLPGLRADGGPVSGHVLGWGGQVAGGAGQHGWQRHQAGLGLARYTVLHSNILLFLLSQHLFAYLSSYVGLWSRILGA